MRTKLFPIVLLALPFLVSCTQKVDLELDEVEPKVVIEGYLVTETDSSFVKLSHTISYFNQGTPPPITDATVEITGAGNTILFQHTANGVYKPAPGYAADTNVVYDLRVLVDGKEYKATSTLYPMFYVNPQLTFDYRQAEGFFPAGYAVTYWSMDARADEVYTQFAFGQNDTLFDQEIFFTNAQLIKNQYLPFELPFFRPQPGDSVMLIFKSIDIPVARYLQALASLSSGAPGPFQTPPANPPTNISGGAVGYFRACDVVRIGVIAP